jgi:predicted enzyme related to lactoylglutathione lyase
MVSSGSYLAMDFGGGVGGGVVECGTNRPSWLPYIEVREIRALTALAHDLGGSVLLEPREGPAGWRSVVAHPAAGEIGLWQPKALPRLAEQLSSSTAGKGRGNLGFDESW